MLMIMKMKIIKMGLLDMSVMLRTESQSLLTKEGRLDKMLVTRMDKVLVTTIDLMSTTKMERMLMTNLDKKDNIAQQSGAPAWHREGEGR